MNKPTRTNRNQHRGLTLVELLVSISLITVVSSMFLVAYRQASAEASNIRTQSTIRKISEVLVSRMQEYENYPINFARGLGNDFATVLPGNATEYLQPSDPGFEPKGLLLERLRVMLLREMISQEMPDHHHDIKDSTPIVKNYWTGLVARRPSNAVGPVFITASESPRAARLKARLIQAATLRQVAQWRTIVNNPELLYLIVEDSSLNGSSALELFGKTEIGDTDGDGLLEFLDASRKPIYWVRWPTGFPDTIRFHPDLLDPSFNKRPPPNDPNQETFKNYVFGDPLDPRKSDPGYRLSAKPFFKPSAMAFPLVISPGVDSQVGVRIELQPGGQADGRYQLSPGSSSTSDVVMPVPYDFATTGLQPQPLFTLIMCDPWFPRNNPSERLGAIVNAKAFEDDITNYSINGAYQ
jgi:prepilin-type N-terminal cleavage/methylation domain-containing protein